MMTRPLITLPALLAIQQISAAPPTVEGFVLRLFEQLPTVAVVVWLWVRDANRRDAAQKASDERYEKLVNGVIEELKKRPGCPIIEREMEADEVARSLVAARKRA